MQLLVLRKARLDLGLKALQTPIFIKSFLLDIRSLGFSSIANFFLFLYLFIALSINLLFFLFCFFLKILSNRQ